MLPIIIIFILACIISFIIIQIYNFMCLKNQYENFKSATYIYMRKKIDQMPKLLNSIRYSTGEIDEIIEIIKYRNKYNEDQNMNENLKILHECNRLIGAIFNKYPNLLKDEEILNEKNEWYSIDASLRENSNQYISCARSYNDMFNNIFVIPIIKIFKYEMEDV